MLREFFSFWLYCAGKAFRNSTAFANDWQWVFGIPVCSLLADVYLRHVGAVSITTGSAIADAFSAALAAFTVTWAVSFGCRLLYAPFALWADEWKRANDLQKQIRILEDSAPKGVPETILHFATERDAHIIPLGSNKYSVMFRHPMRCTPTLKIIEPDLGADVSRIAWEYWSPMGFTVTIPSHIKIRNLRFEADARPAIGR